MAYVDLGATWIDFSDAACGDGKHAWWQSPTGQRGPCVPNNAGETYVPVSKVDKTKYDLIQSLNSGTQLVAKGGTWEGEFKYPDYGGCPAGQIRPAPGAACIPSGTKPTADPTTGVYAPQALNVVTKDPTTGDYIQRATGVPPRGQVNSTTGGSGGGGTYLPPPNPNTGVAVAAPSFLSRNMLLLGALAAVGVGVYIYKKRAK